MADDEILSNLQTSQEVVITERQSLLSVRNA